MRVCFGAGVCPRRFADATGQPVWQQVERGHIARLRAGGPRGFALTSGLVCMVLFTSLCWGCGDRDVAAQAVIGRYGYERLFLRPRQRCGAAHPHVEAPQGWTDMLRARRPFRLAGLLCRREPLPGQRPAVHPVPAGQVVPSILQAGMHRIFRFGQPAEQDVGSP